MLVDDGRYRLENLWFEKRIYMNGYGGAFDDERCRPLAFLCKKWIFVIFAQVIQGDYSLRPWERQLEWFIFLSDSNREIQKRLSKYMSQLLLSNIKATPHSWYPPRLTVLNTQSHGNCILPSNYPPYLHKKELEGDCDHQQSKKRKNCRTRDRPSCQHQICGRNLHMKLLNMISEMNIWEPFQYYGAKANLPNLKSSEIFDGKVTFRYW
jgi:hypothetical protein